MKCDEETCDHLDTSDLKEEGTGGKNRRKKTFIASPKTITHRRVDSNAAYVSTPNDKRSANAISHTVAMDVDAADE